MEACGGGVSANQERHGVRRVSMEVAGDVKREGGAGAVCVHVVDSLGPRSGVVACGLRSVSLRDIAYKGFPTRVC
jgi:hypothetical protein